MSVPCLILETLNEYIPKSVTLGRGIVLFGNHMRRPKDMVQHALNRPEAVTEQHREEADREGAGDDDQVPRPAAPGGSLQQPGEGDERPDRRQQVPTERYPGHRPL